MDPDLPLSLDPKFCLSLSDPDLHLSLDLDLPLLLDPNFRLLLAPSGALVVIMG